MAAKFSCRKFYCCEIKGGETFSSDISNVTFLGTMVPVKKMRDLRLIHNQPVKK